MPVAKSYQKYEIIGNPFKENGRMYVRLSLGNGATKTVRWYTEAEYEKMYPEEKPKDEIDYRKVFGFDKGYITIFNESDEADEEYLYNCATPRYCTHWGWYVVSTDEVPELPEGLEAVRLPWEKVGNDDGTLKSKEEIKLAVIRLLERESSTEWLGEPGDRIERVVYLMDMKTTEYTTYQGHINKKNIFYFSDSEGNSFLWETQVDRNWKKNQKLRIRGTIKEHLVDKGKMTISLSRVSEIK